MGVYFFFAAIALVLMVATSWRQAWKLGLVKWAVSIVICACAWPLFLDGKYFHG